MTGVADAPNAAESNLDVAVDKVITETGCTGAEAYKMLNVWLPGILDRVRSSSNHSTLLTDAEMFVGGYGSRTKSASYAIFDTCVPHDQVSADGSAHQAIENAVLDPSRDEFSLVHHQTGDVLKHCKLTVDLSVAT
jgi:hypothetical protein